MWVNNMVIFSENAFFHLGLDTLTKHGQLAGSDHIAVFDLWDNKVALTRMLPGAATLAAIDPLASYAATPSIIVSQKTLIRLLTEKDAHKGATTYTPRRFNSRGLTQSESNILRMMMQDYTPIEISLTLGISQQTVSAHKRKALLKLGLGSFCSLVHILPRWQRFMCNLFASDSTTTMFTSTRQQVSMTD
jgi:DNA-binding CsgD family transcriptional regulator